MAALSVRRGDRSGRKLIGMGNTANNAKVLLTVRDACELASISRTTLYELIRANRIGTLKIGSRGIRIPVAELERFIQEGLEGSN